MARPKKVGLEYFPLDCRMDDKVEILEAEYGLTGFAVYIKLLQEIYQTEDGKLDMTVVFRWKTLGKRLSIEPDVLENIVKLCLEVGLFDKTSFETDKMLTSNGIQSRIVRVSGLRSRDRNRKSDESEGFPAENESIPAENPRKSAQKEKEKEKENKESTPPTPEPIPAAPDKASPLTPKKVAVRPNVMLLEAELKTLNDKYGPPFVELCLDKLSAQKQSSGKKYASDYGAINSWVVDAIHERNQKFGIKPPVPIPVAPIASTQPTSNRPFREIT